MRGDLLPPVDLRNKLLVDLCDTAVGLLLDPGLNTKKAEQVAALDTIFLGLDALIKATSTSNPGYEIRDLPHSQKQEFEQIKHVLGLLKASTP